MLLEKELTTVTPLSKVIAAIAFITLPIATLFLGIRINSRATSSTCPHFVNTAMEKQSKDIYDKSDTNSIETSGDRIEDFRAQDLSSFLSGPYKAHPTLQKIAAPENITRVFGFTVKDTGTVKGDIGNVIEITQELSGDGTPSQFIYYLVYNGLEKKLDVPNQVENFQVIGNGAHNLVENSSHLARDLQDKNGYILLSGPSPDGFEKQYISIYKISTGEKVSLESTSKGWASGKLVGVYGLSNPTLVIEDGPFWQPPPSRLEDLSDITYYDLQTGKLKYHLHFD